MTDGVVECRDLSFRYGRRWALRDVSVSFGRGVSGLLGPNGAGKSTLLALAATLLRARGGTVRVLGHDTGVRGERRALRRRVGYLPQRFSLPVTMRVLDTVAYAAWMNGVDSRDSRGRAAAALETVDLARSGRRRVGALSGGQRQRLGIAAVLAHDPEVLLLDEPTVGLDPSVRMEFREVLRALGGDRAVLVSTHLVEDVAQVCERVAVLGEGRVVFEGTTLDLAARSGEGGEEAATAAVLERAYASVLREATGAAV